MHRQDLTGHGRGDPALAVPLAARMGQRIGQCQIVCRAIHHDTEHTGPAQDMRARDPPVERGHDFTVRSPAGRRRNRPLADGQVPAILRVLDMDRFLVRTAEDEPGPGPCTDPPTITGGPGRLSLPARALGALGQQQVHRAHHQNFIGHLARIADEAVQMPVDEAGIDGAGSEGVVAHNGPQERRVGRYSGDAGLGERPVQVTQRAFASGVPGDQLGDHGIVMDAHRIALPDAGINTDMTAVLGETQMMQGAGGGQKLARRIFRIHTDLDRMPRNAELGLRGGQRLTGRDTKLPFHQIKPGDAFGHRMLDLETGVHFHEIEPVRRQTVRAIRNEFHGAGTAISDRAGGLGRGLAHGLANLRRHAGRGRFLDHFLMAPLQ